MWNSFILEIKEILTLQSKQQAQYTVDGMLLLLLPDANNTLKTEAVHKFGKNGNNKSNAPVQGLQWYLEVANNTII